MFGKKKDAASAESAPAPIPMANGLTPLMTVSTELVSISHDAVSPDAFMPPADFKKVSQ